MLSKAAQDPTEIVINQVILICHMISMMHGPDVWLFKGTLGFVWESLIGFDYTKNLPRRRPNTRRLYRRSHIMAPFGPDRVPKWFPEMPQK